MARKKQSIPVPRLHKPSGRARLYVNGEYVYIGPWGSVEADREYRRIIAEMMNGPTSAQPADITVSELVACFLKHAKDYYRDLDGKSTGSFERYVLFVRPLVALYGTTPVSQFGPLALKSVREEMIRSGLARKTVNSRIVQLRTIFKWGVSNEMVPETVYRALLTVTGLQPGRTNAKELPPVPQVKKADVIQTIAVAHKTLADMIRVQFLSGMRPKEVRLMRSCDIDRSDDIWVYIPHRHKTQYRGKHRPIPIMPPSQAILMPYLIDKEERPDEYLFRPGDAMKLICFEKRMKRKTKVQPSQRNRKKKKRKHPFLPYYTKDAYLSAIKRAAERAGVPPWSPNQLRHTQATEVNSTLGIEAAQLLLGHASPETTKIYLDPDVQLKEQIEAVKEVARKIDNYSNK